MKLWLLILIVWSDGITISPPMEKDVCKNIAAAIVKSHYNTYAYCISESGETIKFKRK